MISSLRGRVLAAAGSSLVIDVGGVGFQVNTTPALVLASPGRADEYFRWNSFGPLARVKAIRIAAPGVLVSAPATPAPRPARRAGNR